MATNHETEVSNTSGSSKINLEILSVSPYLCDMSKAKFIKRYLGVTITADNYREILNKEGRYGINFHTKHLKAYLRGDTHFNYDYERDEEGRIITDAYGFRVPKRHRVQREFKRIKNQ